MFSSFDNELISDMKDEELTYHYHEWAVTLDTYTQSEAFQSMVKIISTDKMNGVDFITSFEGHTYPIFGIMYHPEFAFLNVHSDNHGLQISTDSKRLQIALNVTRFLKKVGLERRSEIENPEVNDQQGLEDIIENHFIDLYPLNE